MIKTFYAPRWKKEKRFFKWLELCDDGYGIYYASGKEIEHDDIPLLLNKRELSYRKNSFYSKMYDSDDCRISEDEIEFVEVTVTYKD